MSKKMAGLVDHGIATLDAPQSPKGLAATKAALATKLQRTMNIALGSALAAIGLTIPAVLGVGLATGKRV